MASISIAMSPGIGKLVVGGSDRSAVRRFATVVLLLALPIALFLAFFHPATLDIGNAGWLIRGSDNGENALGAHAYWHDPAAGASLKTGLLNAPEGVPILYTDSNPLITLAAKPIARLLPADAQLVGPFILLSLILQACFAWLLLRGHAPGRSPCGRAWPCSPSRRRCSTVSSNVNLMAHWALLAALWLFLDRERSRKLTWWAPLIAITALIHSYLLVMVGAIWASAMLARFFEGSGRVRLATIGHAAAVLAMVAAIAWWLGVGGQVPAGNFGAFSMPLDALWNPGIGNFSKLLPAYERSPGRGFEGFQYLGAGGLLLVASAVVIARFRPVRTGEQLAGRRLKALVPALIVLAILAIAHMPLPPLAMAALDPVRASGRLFWPIGYVLVLMAILAVFACRASALRWHWSRSSRSR